MTLALIPTGPRVLIEKPSDSPGYTNAGEELLRRQRTGWRSLMPITVLD
jgi:hypothetical protein